MAQHNVAMCGTCNETLYASDGPIIIRNHDCRILPDGRAEFYARGLGIVVHRCGEQLHSRWEIANIGEELAEMAAS